MATLRIDDFSGGITDNYVNGPINAARTMDNFLLTKNRKPYVRYGSGLYDPDLYQIPAGAQRTGEIHFFQDILWEQSARNIYYRSGGSWNTLTGPVDSNPVFGAGTTANYISIGEWQGHMYLTIDEFSSPRKIYHDGSNWQVRTAGLPALASAPTVTPDVDDGSSYIYYFFHQVSYTVGTVTHIEQGPVTSFQVTNAADMSGAGHYNQISAIPVMSNSTTECWDSATITVEIYRTEDGLIQGRKVGQVTNGTTTFQDDVTDANLGIIIYTEGGVYDNDPPPQAKYLAIADDIGWYMNVKEGSEERGYRIRQSLRNNIDSCPESFYVDVDDEITGGSNVDIYPIVFTKNKTYRLEGFVDSLGRGSVRKRVVSDKVGCVSNNGIVRLVHGLFFPARDGFYYTDGFKLQKLSDHLNESYVQWTASDAQAKRMSGVFDRVSGRIYWTYQSDPGDTEADKIIVLDPFWGLSNQSSFTTWSSGIDMQPTSLEFIDDELVRADSRGYSLIHKADYYTDPVIDISAIDPSYWETKAVVYEYLSCAIPFGTETIRKYVTKLLTIAKNLSNLSLQPFSINDDSSIEKQLKEVRFRSNMTWGDGDVTWGDADVYWNYSGLILAQRRFPRTGLRCTYKQVGFRNSNTMIAGSDDYSDATVAASAKTVTLDDAVTYDWPEDVVGFFIYFSDDSYTQAFEISARTADVLTVFDPAGDLTDGSKSWELRGFKKSERFQLEAMSVDYEMFGMSHTHYAEGDDAANA